MVRVGSRLLIAALPFASLACTALGLRAADYHPQIDPAQFSDAVDHPFFPLVTGTVTRFVERAGGEVTRREVRVTSERRVVLGVRCVVVYETATARNTLAEDSRSCFAQDASGSVWLFAEEAREIAPDGAVDTSGSWEAGVEGAQPGIVMPSPAQPGEPFRQEYLLGVAEDLARVVAVDQTVETAAGTFAGCVETRDWSALEAGSERKWYAPGVGLVRVEALGGDSEELVERVAP